MPPMPCPVRPARPEDVAVPELLYVSAQPYYDAYAGTPERARRMLAAVYPKQGHTASWAICRVAELDERVVGASAVFNAAAGDALAVDAAARRRGVATALLEDAERAAAAAGLTGVSLDTGLRNSAAQALYEAYGFEVRDVREAPS